MMGWKYIYSHSAQVAHYAKISCLSKHLPASYCGGGGGSFKARLRMAANVLSPGVAEHVLHLSGIAWVISHTGMFRAFYLL